MDALHASYRALSLTVVIFLWAAAVLASFINSVVAVILIQPQQGWLMAFAVVYLVLAVALPAVVARRGRRSGMPRLVSARQAILASLILNLLAAPVTLGALAM